MTSKKSVQFVSFIVFVNKSLVKDEPKPDLGIGMWLKNIVLVVLLSAFIFVYFYTPKLSPFLKQVPGEPPGQSGSEVSRAVSNTVYASRI